MSRHFFTRIIACALVRFTVLSVVIAATASIVVWRFAGVIVSYASTVTMLAATGMISATPNPIKVCDGSGLGSTKLTWSSSGATRVEVRLNSPTGALVASGLSGSFTTSKSVSHGTVFYLQDLSGKSPLTLTTVTVGLTTAGCAPPTPTPTPPSQTPFNGQHNVPGITEAEDFDNGGEGVAYHDNDVGNAWGAYRIGVNVDIYADSNTSAGFVIGNAQAGEWLEYTVNVTATVTASYDLVARVASDGAGGTFHYVIDPDSANPISTSQLTAPNTFGWGNYQNAPAARVSLTPGPHIIRLVLDQNGTQPAIANFDNLNFTAVSGAVTNNAAFVSQSVPTAMTAGQSYSVSVTLQNTGTSTWTAADNYLLGTQNPQDNTIFGDTALGFGRIGAPSSVAPGSNVTFSFTVTAPSTPGTYNFQRRMLRVGVEWFGAFTQNVAVNVTPTPPSQTPFNGQHNVPGITEAEDFDNGGEGVAYHDNDVGNAWGAYRTNVNVDIYADSNTSAGFVIGNAQAGEWLEYTVNVTATVTASYDLVARVASDGAGGTFHYVIDPDSANPISTSQLTAPNTFGWGNYQNAPAARVSLTPGPHIIRLVLDQNGTQPAIANFDNLNFTAVSGAVTNNAAFVSQSVPTAMTAGQSYSVSVTLQNTGTSTWTAADNYLLGTQNPQDNTIFGDTALGFGRIGAPSSVAPGSNVTFSFTVTAPSTPGTYNFQRRMLRVGVEWFGAFTQNVAVNVTSAAPSPDNFSAAMVDPVNRTGQPAEDLFSGNYNWSLPLVGLSGRAGLDLELLLTYNSLVWTKSGSSIKFDSDNGFPAPGFRLGFPVIQPQTYSSQGGVPAYLMIMSSGARVELRRVAANIYESADSSYIQFNDLSGTVRPPDGSVLTYRQQIAGGDFMCTEIKDRNGNKITVSYIGSRISTITDTLGRVLAFNYPTGNLDSITQTWNGAPHTWATFTYQTISLPPNFPGLTVIAPAGFPALSTVRLADGSTYRFDYTSLGQVSGFHHLAPDGHELANTSYLTNNSTSDCPRVSQRTDFAENWMTVSTSYPNIGATNTSVPGRGRINLPDGTSLEEDSPVSGFSRGLPTQSRIISGGVTKKTTSTIWTQDNPGLGYPANPRISDTTVSDDAGNQRRTSFAYTSFNLVSDVTEYDAGGVNPLRKTHTDYLNYDLAGKGRIIGLPSMVLVCDGSGATSPCGGFGTTQFSKVSYTYDGNAPAFQGEPVQHDASYGTTFITGRGNLTAVTRWDVDTGQSVQVKLTGYNTTGNPIFVRDAIRNVLTISYADSFSASSPAGLTLAYPTTITDGDNFSSTSTYHYDLGVTTSTHDPKGAEMLMEYNDAAGRLTRQSSNSGTYTRLEYRPNGTEVRSFTLLDHGIPESFAAQVTDGAGRTIGAVKNLPGSASGYGAQKMIYDNMGRLRQQSNPAEISYTLGQPVANWSPTGDDAGAWVFSTQDYDWKGRPRTTTNQDGTFSTMSYGGCGCAGGEVVTVTDEGTIDGGVPKRRQQKIYSDVLGRPVKTELLQWEGGTVYATTVNIYNARDQVTRIIQYQGPDTSPVFQVTDRFYDGHGRLRSEHRPEQAAGTLTTINYNDDDLVRTVTDARGASTTFTYNNNRHLVTEISYAGGALTPTTTFGYDAAGNRTSMSDGAGSCTYAYDTWSRMTSETRQFTGLAQSHTLGYTYNFAGQLKSITDPFNATINYGIDQAGKLANVTGSSFGGVTQYASGITYRAWGGVKRIDRPNTSSVTVGYNSRLQVSTFRKSGLMNKIYDYHADGTLRYSQDITDDRLDRLFSYDHVGRVRRAWSGLEARGGAATNDRPYFEAFTYDAFNHITSRNTRHWSQQLSPVSSTYVNNRNQAWEYDADGNLVHLNSPGQNILYTLDAAGRPTIVRAPNGTEATVTYDGNGLTAKSIESHVKDLDFTTLYYVRSSVLGGRVVTELTDLGAKKRTFVYAGGSVMATQWEVGQEVEWEYRDPSGASFRALNQAGFCCNSPETEWAELDPAGANMGLTDPYLAGNPPPETEEALTSYPNFGNPRDPYVRYTWMGMAVSFDTFMMVIGNSQFRVNVIRENDSFLSNLKNELRQSERQPPTLGNYGGNPSHIDDTWYADEAYDEDGWLRTDNLLAQNQVGRFPLKLKDKAQKREKKSERDRKSDQKGFDACQSDAWGNRIKNGFKAGAEILGGIGGVAGGIATIEIPIVGPALLGGGAFTFIVGVSELASAKKDYETAVDECKKKFPLATDTRGRRYSVPSCVVCEGNKPDYRGLFKKHPVKP